jgi:hypothetical protein
MRRTALVLVTTFLRRHPPSEILQACVDRELSPLAHRLTRSHTAGCAACQREMRSSLEVLELIRSVDAPADDLALVRDRIMSAMSAASAQRQNVANDLSRLLGRRAADRLNSGTATPEVRVELAAFLGNRAAESFLGRLAG